MANPATSEYMFLMRGANWGDSLSPGVAQEGLEAMMAWIEDLKIRGILTSGQPLSPVGHVVSSNTGSLMDGPFVETKEAVGGYLMIRASSPMEAKQFASDCPVLKYGLVIEVRPIIGQCPMADELGLDYTNLSVTAG